MKQNMVDAYAEGHHEAANLLDRLSDLLGDMPPPDADGINWGHVGSLRHVIAMLKEIETHLEGATQCPAN